MAQVRTDITWQLKGCILLLELASHNAQVAAVATLAAGGIPILISVMRSHSTNAHVLSVCINVLSRLCQSDENRMAIVAADGMSLVFAAMGVDAHGDCCRLVANGCHFVCNLTVVVTLCQSMVDVGVIPLLVTLMTVHTRILEIQEHCMAALHNFAMHSPATRAVIREAGGVCAAMVNMKKDPTQRRMHNVGFMLLRLTSCELAAKQEMVTEGGIPLLLAAMKTNEQTVKTRITCIAIVNNIAVKNPEYQKLIIVAGGVDAVLVAMKRYPENVILQKYGCHFLRQLVAEATQKEVVTTSGTIPVLLQTMSEHAGVKGVHQLAFYVLYTLAQSNPAIDKQLKSDGAVSVFTALVAQEGIGDKCRKDASECLARIADA